jgi:aminoglycoside phosphotransferase (APT) family kinase protein
MINRAQALSPGLRATILATLDRLPDGEALTHGDFHPDNIVVSPKGPVIIDWHTASQGNPVADVAYSALLFRLGALPPAGLERWLFEAGREIARSLYLRTYKQLTGVTQAELDAWTLPVAAARLGAGIPEEERALRKLIIAQVGRANQTKEVAS